MIEQAKDVKSIVQRRDVEAVAKMMQIWRDGGLAPSDVVRKGIEYAEDYVREEFPDLGRRKVAELAALVWSDAAKAVGVHAGQRRAEKQIAQ